MTEPERHEYGCLTCRVDIVTSVDAAVAHVNRHSSGHTDCVAGRRYSNAAVPAPGRQRGRLPQRFDAVCGRFSFWPGRGAGHRDGRIREGPVGAAASWTYKWLLRSAASHAVADFGAVPCVDAPGAAARGLAREGLCQYRKRRLFSADGNGAVLPGGSPVDCTRALYTYRD